MTVEEWPGELPRPMRSGFQYAMGDPRKRTQPDEGPQRSGRRYSQTADPVNMTLDLSVDQLAVFEHFWKLVTRFGSKVFYMPAPVYDEVGLQDQDGTPLLDENGTPILLAAVWLCQFGDQTPAFAPIGVRWRISFQVMVMP